jgi:S-adenosylmethionine uptake transporter
MALSDNMRGAVLMTLSMAAFTLNDACMKALSEHLPFWQALFLRGLAVCVVMGAGVALLGQVRVRLPGRVWGLIALRALGEVGAAYFFITALFHMPLANTTAILQALPLAVTLAGALFFRERVGWRRWLAIAVGFSGVMLIVRPGAEGFTVYSVYALVSVVAVTLRDLVTRRLPPDAPSGLVALTGAVAVTLFGGAGALVTDWAPVTLPAAGLLAGAVVAVLVGYLLSVTVMRVGEIGFVAPFRYTSLIWSLMLGILVFGEFPDSLTLLGGAVVVATGLFTLYRERVRGRRTAAEATPAT